MTAILEKISFTFRGFAKRITQMRSCPSCGATESSKLLSKGPYLLLECKNCLLRYRYPGDTREQMENFYQDSYAEEGLTTDLPDAEQLDELVSANFRNSDKDFSRFIVLFRTLEIEQRSKLLDFGANWGYGTHQFSNAGYSATGFELSKPRANFGNKFGQKIYTSWKDVEREGPYDVVFSSHVLEHTPDPTAALRDMASQLRTGGYLISVFPNGTQAFLDCEPWLYNRSWGKVHPMLLSADYVRRALPGGKLMCGAICDHDLEKIANWDRKSDLMGTLNGSELLIVWLNQNV